MNSNLRTTLVTLALVVTTAPTLAASDAFGRATVLGRAHGAAIACNAPEAERSQFRGLAEKELRRLAVNPGDVSDATTRMALETGKARRAVEGGSIACKDALSFYKDQFKGLRGQKR